MLTGNNSILTQSIEAKNQYEIANEKERIELAVLSATLNQHNNNLTTDTLQEELQKEFKSDFGTLIGDTSWIYVGKNETYNISNNGDVSIEKTLNYKIYGNNSRLPNGYQEIEYLESTVTQFINTNYSPQIADEIIIRNVKCIGRSNFQSIFSAGTGTYQLILLVYSSGAYYKYFATGNAPEVKTRA